MALVENIQNVRVISQASGDSWCLFNGDCVEVTRGLPDQSIGFTVFSPPFASLYTYSNSDRDMGNSKTHDEFTEHFRFLIGELHRVTKPGRLCSVHCMQLPLSKTRDGVIGIRDFRGEIVRDFIASGWVYHSEVCIWKDPVTAMQRTKAIGLLHKQMVKDSCMSRQGIPDYVCTFRKPGENPEPVAGELDHFAGDRSTFRSGGPDAYRRACESYRHYLTLKTDDERWEYMDSGGITEPPNKSYYVMQGNTRLSIDIWQRYASPVWMDIDPSNTLQYMAARDEKDERHICPLQLDVIERCLQLWSNPGDVVLSPFAGIGSEIYQAVVRGRKGIGVELKESYFRVAVKNCRIAEEKAKEAKNLLF